MEGYPKGLMLLYSRVLKMKCKCDIAIIIQCPCPLSV